MRLPENLRERLRKPMGLLLENEKVTRESILKHLPESAFLATVGDATTEKMIGFGLEPSLQIVDSLEKRVRREPPHGKARLTIRCSNPPAEITEESIAAIKNALSQAGPVRILVTGEEDLLVLPVVLYAPENSIVMYGQPNEGLVVVEVNQKTKNTAKTLMDSME